MTAETNIDKSTVTPACSNKTHRLLGEYRQICLETYVTGRKLTKVTLRLVLCLACGRFWRSKAKYVEALPGLEIDDLRANRRVVERLKLRLQWDDSKPYAQRPHWMVLMEEIDELSHNDRAYAKVADIVAEALGVPTTLEGVTVESRLRTLIEAAKPESASKWTADQLAYDGSAEPQKRDLTPRERDILCRLLRRMPASLLEDVNEARLMREVRDVLTPRES